MTSAYKELGQKCKCGQKMLEVLGYIEKQDGDEHPQAYRKGWYCPWCKNWEDAILRERIVEEE